MAIILDGTNGISTPDVEPTGSTVPTNGVYLPAANSVGIATNSTNAVYINSSQNVGIGTSSPTRKLQISSSGSTCAIRLDNTVSGRPTILAYDDSQNLTLTNSSDTGYFAFVNGTGAGTERARIDSSGYLLINQTSNVTSSYLQIKGAQPAISCESTSTGSVSQVLFRNPNGQVGSIGTSGTSTSYNTSSDYRLKENIAPMTGALAKVAALNPVTYNWKVDGSAGQGFIAHELQAVVPDCVTGEKDAVDAEGKPQYQGVDTSFLVATLTAAIKEQQALIEQLTTRIAALEAK